MAEYHNVKSLSYDGSPITRVASIRWEPLAGAGLSKRIDASSKNITLGRANAGFVGTVSFLDQAQADAFADEHTGATMLCVVLTSADVEATVTGGTVTTGPVRGFSHNLSGSGPYEVKFVAVTMSAPV